MSQGFAEFCVCGHKKSDHHPEAPHRCIENFKHPWEEIKEWPLFTICSCDAYKEQEKK